MQFTSNTIVALLLTVSTSSVTAAQKSTNLRGGGSNPQKEKAFSDPSPSGLSSIMNDAANPPLPNLDRSLVDGLFDSCTGLDYRISECDDYYNDGGSCTNYQITCWSVINQECYCH